MKSVIISVSNLKKSFSFPIKKKGVGFFENLFNPEYKKVLAVDNISFSVNKGERIAFIGPNGAGKSTTIKMLTGILTPTDGSISVLGIDPGKDRKKLAYQIGTVFGQRSQLFPNLPLTDSFEFFGVMYDLTDSQIKNRSKELIEVFDLGDFVNQPVRKLSLGQRMRAEIATSLIHNPKIIFLDEPTIGLDVVAKKALRELLLKINTTEDVTIFLTSHDVGDIEYLCERTVIVNQGKIVMDMSTQELGKSFVHEKYINLVLDDELIELPELPTGVKYHKVKNEFVTLAVDLHILSISAALQKVLSYFSIADMNVEDIGLESVIREMYETTKIH